jgi:PHD/YefM family antitoxin component YafN of YafNO toxin-antitoxin module
MTVYYIKMEVEMEIYTISQARANLFNLIKDTELYGPIYIVGKNSKSVLISEDDYKVMIKELNAKKLSLLEIIE